MRFALHEYTRINNGGLVEIRVASEASFYIRVVSWVPPEAGPQRKYPWRLFIKNTALCELVRGCIEGDA